ncbi:MAG: DNA-binding protein [Desulfurococcales archaeon ex4484_58]|nr:MAG: DNA-binding protein [Desulfurococcales archaeon ex4484_58]
MRGWTHFLSGLAMASFFPELLADLRMGILLPVITGVYGYLPDFIDFKIRRFLWKRDYIVDPAPWDPKLKIAPMTIKVKDVREDKRYQFYALEGVVTSVLSESNDRIIFKLRDDTGEIRVEAFMDDYIRFKKIYGDIKPGDKIRVPGYIDIDNEGLKLVFSDAPHPQYIASMIAKAIDEAYESGRMITVKVFNIRMSGDIYRRFLIHYDMPTRSIKVYIGPLVTTGGVPIKGTEVPEYRRVGEAQTKYPFLKTYPRPTVIDAFSGPEIGYQKTKLPDGREVVEEVFIPWHRGFSHSFTAGILFALLLAPILYLINYHHIWQLVIASMLGYWMHVIEDQLGFMGNNLLPPLTKKRIPGLMLGPNIYTGMNFATSWLMISLITWNINRFTTPRPVPLSDPVFLLILLIPTIVIYSYGVWDSIKFRRLYKVYWKYYATLEALNEEELIGGI